MFSRRLSKHSNYVREKTEEQQIKKEKEERKVFLLRLSQSPQKELIEVVSLIMSEKKKAKKKMKR